MGGFRGLYETGLTCETWKVGWILIEDGTCDQTANGLMILAMGKGQMNLGASFIGVFFNLLLFVESHRI